MTEPERLIVIERIKKDLELQKICEQNKKRLEELKQNELVKEYLKLFNEIEELNKQLCYFENEEQAISKEFVWALNTKYKAEGFSSCNHDIWMYIGSYGWKDYGFFDGYNYLIDDESKENFNVNKYKCLECGIYINVTDWNRFEQDNFVLKNRKDLDGEAYMFLYYQLLYNHTVEEAQKLVIEEFNKNKCLTKKIK